MPAAAAKGKQAPVRSQKPITLAQVWNVDATYRDAQHGITFRYPSIWQAETQFAYIPPALSRPSPSKPIAGFAFSEGGVPRDQSVGPYSGTNLEGFGIVYSVVSANSSAGCRASAASLGETPESHTAVLAGRPFWVFETFGGAMMQSTSGKLYATYANRQCYLFETDVAAASMGEQLEGVRQLSDAEFHSIEVHLLRIMKSVRIKGMLRQSNTGKLWTKH